MHGWSIGIATSQEAGDLQDARIVFHLHGDRTKSATVVTSKQGYDPERWVHVAATFNNHQMALYIDGGKVGTGHGQRSPLHVLSTMECKEIVLGGDYIDQRFYRGLIDNIKLWTYARSHQQIVDDMYNEVTTKPPNLVFHEQFLDFNQWQPTSETLPRLAASSIDHDRHDIKLTPSPCGITVCDDPKVIQSYTMLPELRREKIVRYRVVNVLDDDGRNPTVTNEQITLQHKALKDVFRPYNISWKLEERQIRNSSLRQRTILIACEAEKVGNKLCNPECQHERTGKYGCSI